MKHFSKILTFILGLSFITAESEARGDGKSGNLGNRNSGGSRVASPSRGSGSSNANRSPVTGSKIERPASKPTTRPASMPASRPESRPSPQPTTQRPASQPSQRPVQRPSVERPPTQLPSVQRPPAQLPSVQRPPTQLPSVQRPPTQLPSVQRPSVDRPSTRPDSRPGAGGANRPDNTRPDTRPGAGGVSRPDNNRPGTRPGAGGTSLPGTKPATRPELGNRPGYGGNGIGNRPGGSGNSGSNRPNINRPGIDRPSTLPGMVTYPNRPGNNSRPNWGSGNNSNIGNTYIKNVNKDRRNIYLNRPANRPVGNLSWDNNRWGGNRGVWGNNNTINIRINNSFRNSNNYSYRPNYWGARPWWSANNCHGWHHGHWNYGYNKRYYSNRYYHRDSSFSSGFMWGIAVWSLGNMVYDMGYQSYRNPYPAPPVQSYSSKTTINYTQPISVTAAANPPGDEAATTLAETKSADATAASRTAFKAGDYVTALKSVDEAIAHTPGDVTLHEYRSLVLFALGRYSDAAGVLNPVLASGPGWGWDTMVGFYDSSFTYTTQLRKLEAYVKGRPDAADGRFVLGYHYLVCNYMDKAYEQFEKVTTLQPADSISRQLRDLTKSSIPDGGDAETEPPAKPDPVPVDQLVGTWVSDRGQDGKVIFTMTQDGNYTWAFMNGDQSSELKGTYGLNDLDLLVLTSDDTQMVSAIEMIDGGKLKFVLIGAPDGDPGLEFTKG